MPIQILTEAVASQIAAGEVVERPASVVKELAENALDAGATEITVTIVEAGRRLIEIADNGGGMPAEELALAVARHATSKLRSADDLFHIHTLGFRGEALASIASVSRFTLTSHQRVAQVGARLRVEGGHVTATTEPVGAPVGTVVRVEDLFYNVPARLKFLKVDATERRQIDALITRYALAYAQVRFHLLQDGKPVLQTSGNGDRREVLANLYGVDTARQMLSVDFVDEGLKVSGFISPVALTRSNRKDITFFVNGRWVQDTSLAAALLQAYRTLLMVGRYPIAALLIELPAEDVDVNVHPAKSEVRFRQADRVFSAVQRAVRRALLAYSPVPGIAPGGWSQPLPQPSAESWQPDPNATGTNYPPGAAVPVDADRPRLDWESMPPGEEAYSPAAAPSVDDTPSQGELPGTLPLLRLVGQIGASYLVAEGPDGLYLIDQHAAHERVLFERFMRQRNTAVPAQSLLEPALIQLPPAQARLLTDQLTALEHLGFDLEPFGPNTFRLRAMPALLTGLDPHAAVRVVVEDFEEDETPMQSEVEAKLIARVCKRAAVKAGQSLSPAEQTALLHDLERCASPRTCPHGRPTMIHLSVNLLERQFGRRGSR